MANSTTHLDNIPVGQSQKEVLANELLDAASPATLYGRRASTSDLLTWGFYGGAAMLSNGSLTSIINSVVALTASCVNYLEASPSTALLSKVTSQFTPGKIPLYTVHTSDTQVNSYSDHRLTNVDRDGRSSITMSDANYTLTAMEARNRILEFGGTLTSSRTVTMPLDERMFAAINNTAHILDLKTATGSGIQVASGKSAILYTDGTRVRRLTADA